MHVHFYYKEWLKLGYSIFFLDKTCTSLALCHTQIQFCIFFGIFYSTQPPNSSCFDSDVDLTLQKIRGLCLLKLGISRKASKICQIFRIRKLKYIHLFTNFILSNIEFVKVDAPVSLTTYHSSEKRGLRSTST